MKENTEKIGAKRKKKGPKGHPPETAQKIVFLHKSLVRKSWGNWGPEKNRFWAPGKEKEKERKKTKKMKENERNWKKMIEYTEK